MVRRWAGSRAFTLIEVVVATTIIAIIMGSLFFTFQTAMKAYSVGLGRSEGDQVARFVMGQIADDLRNVYFKSEAEYNVARRQREAQLMLERQQQMQSGANVNEVDEYELDQVLGPPVDLSFRATDNGETDDITFVRLQHLTRRENRKPWGMARLRYYVEGDSLMRSVDDVLAPGVDKYGNEIPKAVKPEEDRLARGVEAFELKFGYWYDKEWFEANDWDSSSRTYRNPSDEEETEQFNPGAVQAMGQPGRGIVNAADPLSAQQSMPDDNLPAWVEVTVEFRDPNREDRRQTYKQIIQFPQAQETYLPPQQDPNQERRRTPGRGRS